MEGGDRANFEGRACQEKRELLRAEYLFAKGQDEVWEVKRNPKSLCEEPMFHTACSRHLSHSNCLSLCVFVIHPCVCVCVLHRPKITRLDFKRSRLTLVVVEDDDQVCVFTLHAVPARGHLSGD